jgi:NTP pyrophosphatase (non-canonical NTP hydrolase)
MSLAAYQKQIDDSVQPYAKPYWDPLSQLAGIIEEVGEVARILNHAYGDKPKKPTEEHEALANELADIVYGVLCLANSEGITDLGPALQQSIDKLETRDKNRFQKKKPD